MFHVEVAERGRLNDESRHFRASYPGTPWQFAGDVIRAVVALARANRSLGGLAVRDLTHGVGGLPLPPAGSARPDPLLAERLAYVIPRVGRRVPWRSDCLVQALAARQRLAAAGIASALHIGTRKDAAGQFEAHAWLTVGDLVVTGWDIAGLAGFAEFPVQSVAP